MWWGSLYDWTRISSIRFCSSFNSSMLFSSAIFWVSSRSSEAVYCIALSVFREASTEWVYSDRISKEGTGACGGLSTQGHTEG